MTPALPSLSIRSCADRWRELRRIVQIRRLTSPNAKARAESRRIRSLTPIIVSEFLAGITRKDLAKKHEVKLGTVWKIVAAGTTEGQRAEVKEKHHRRHSRDSSRKKRSSKWGYKPTLIPIGPYRSLREASIDAGITEQTARNYHRAGIPFDKWREEWHKRKNWKSGPREGSIPVGKFPSLLCAAKAAGVSKSTASRYRKAGLPVEAWKDTATRNITRHKTAEVKNDMAMA